MDCNALVSSKAINQSLPSMVHILLHQWVLMDSQCSTSTHWFLPPKTYFATNSWTPTTHKQEKKFGNELAGQFSLRAKTAKGTYFWQECQYIWIVCQYEHYLQGKAMYGIERMLDSYLYEIHHGHTIIPFCSLICKLHRNCKKKKSKTNKNYTQIIVTSRMTLFFPTAHNTPNEVNWLNRW
jgi:hypothetical protein